MSIFFFIFNIFMSVIMMGCGLLSQSSMGDKTVCFGIRIPYGYEKDKEIIKACKKYRRNLVISYTIFTIILMTVLFLVNEEYQPVIILINAFCGIGIIQICYYKAYKVIKDIKKNNNWKDFLKDKSIIVDLKFRKKSKSNKTLAIYIICFVITFIDLAILIKFKATNMYYLVIIQFLTVILGLVLYNKVLKVKQNLNGGPLEIIKDKAILKRKFINDIIAWSIAVTSIINSLIILNTIDIINESVVLIISIVISTIPIIFIFIYVKKINSNKNVNYGEMITEDSAMINRDDDDLYIGGMFYYNPMDPALMVESRAGVGIDMNYAKTGAKIITTIIIAVLMATVLGVFLLSYNMKKMDIDITEDSISITGSMIYSDNIKYNEIEEVTIEKMPKCMLRTNGAAIGNVKIGSFKTDGYGNVRLYVLNDKNQVIRIKYNNGQYIFINFEDENKTKEVYKKIDKYM